MPGNEAECAWEYVSMLELLCADQIFTVLGCPNTHTVSAEGFVVFCMTSELSTYNFSL